MSSTSLWSFNSDTDNEDGNVNRLSHEDENSTPRLALKCTDCNPEYVTLIETNDDVPDDVLFGSISTTEFEDEETNNNSSIDVSVRPLSNCASSVGSTNKTVQYSMLEEFNRNCSIDDNPQTISEANKVYCENI